MSTEENKAMARRYMEEVWYQEDMLGMMQQLGVIPQPEQSGA